MICFINYWCQLQFLRKAFPGKRGLLLWAHISMSSCSIPVDLWFWFVRKTKSRIIIMKNLSDILLKPLQCVKRNTKSNYSISVCCFIYVVQLLPQKANHTHWFVEVIWEELKERGKGWRANHEISTKCSLHNTISKQKYGANTKWDT